MSIWRTVSIGSGALATSASTNNLHRPFRRFGDRIRLALGLAKIAKYDKVVCLENSRSLGKALLQMLAVPVARIVDDRGRRTGTAERTVVVNKVLPFHVRRKGGYSECGSPSCWLFQEPIFDGKRIDRHAYESCKRIFWTLNAWARRRG